MLKPVVKWVCFFTSFVIIDTYFSRVFKFRSDLFDLQFKPPCVLVRRTTLRQYAGSQGVLGVIVHVYLTSAADKTYKKKEKKKKT